MFSFPVLLEKYFFVDDTYAYDTHESIHPGMFFPSGTPYIYPGNTGVYDLVTLGRVIWVIDTIRTRLLVRAHTLTRADCALVHESSRFTNVGQEDFLIPLSPFS